VDGIYNYQEKTNTFKIYLQGGLVNSQCENEPFN